MRLRLLVVCSLAACTAPTNEQATDAGSSRPGFTHGVSTLAGWSNSGDVDGPRDVNLFANPVNVAYGPDGMVYVADFDNGKLRAVDATGTATTVIAQQGFSRPFGMAFASDGTLYVSTDDDPYGTHNPMSGTIWRIDIAAKTATPIILDLGRPRSLAALADGRLVAADDLHDIIEIIDPRTETAGTLAGTWNMPGAADGASTVARFSTPYGVVQRADGTIIVCDWANSEVRSVGLDGTVATIAGSPAAGFVDGAMIGSAFDHPQAIAMASNGDLFVTDLGNNRVRRISGTVIDTIAGNGTQGYADSDDDLSAEFYGLEGVAVKPDGSMIFVADGTRGGDAPYNRVRQIEMQ